MQHHLRKLLRRKISILAPIAEDLIQGLFFSSSIAQRNEGSWPFIYLREGRLKGNSTNQHVFSHDPVAYKTIQRVLKSCGPIVLKKEMPHPGKAVADDR
jgi:hypothetical protein